MSSADALLAAEAQMRSAGPLLAGRLPELLDNGHPDRPAVTFRDRTVSYRELSGMVSAAAAGLCRLGVRPGERVAVYLDKRIETVAVLFAVSAAGAVLVPVNPVARPRQLAYVVEDCSAAVLVTTPERLATVDATGAALPSLRHVVVLGGPSRSTRRDVTTWDELCRPGPPRPEPPGPAADEIAAIFYTSGSTGGPKGVVVTYGNLLTGAWSVAGYLEHTAEDVVLAVLPLSFDAGFSQLTTAFAVGAHVVLVNYLLPREVVRLCERHAVTALTCVPPLWWQLAEQAWPPAATRHLRYFASTGGRMPAPVLDRLRAVFPAAAPYLMYGLTEAFRSTYLDPAQVDRRPESIGRAIPGAEVLVVRPDGSPCAPGEPGELVHRGPLVALGYWNDPERTRQRFRPYPPGGELAVWSGDTVYRDAEGYLYFVGRADDMIKTSGYRVSPSEIEDAAYASGLVGEAVAFGVPDDVLGQHIVLAVAGRGGQPCDTDRLAATLRRDLPAYQVPRRLVGLAGLPRSGNGKFDRAALSLQVAGGA